MDDLNRLHAGHFLGSADIDAYDLAMGIRSTQHLAEQHLRTLNVVGVTRSPRNFIRGIHARDALANQRTMFRIGPLIVRHGLCSFPRDLRDSATNSPVGPAAADVPAKPMKKIFLRWIGMLIEQTLPGHDKPRRAEPAL